MSLAEELGYDDVHEVHIERGNQGFGFNIKGTTQAGGVLQAINGRLYPPLQYISHVDHGGAAWRAGLRCWDRVLGVNNTDMRGCSHNEVVKNIIRGGDVLDLVVIRVDDEEAARLQRLEDAASSSRKGRGKSAAISIQDFNNLPNPNGKGNYTVFNVYTHGDYRTSKRYSELATLHKQLKARFRWHTFPPFPPKKMNGLFAATLGPSELENRREALQTYLQKVFAVEDIRNSELMNSFLEPTDYRPPNAPSPSSSSPQPAASSAESEAKTTAAPAKKESGDESVNKEPTKAPKEEPKRTATAPATEKETEKAKKPSAPSSAKKKAVPANLFDFDDEEPIAAASGDEEEEEEDEEGEEEQEAEKTAVKKLEEEEAGEEAGDKNEEQPDEQKADTAKFRVLTPTGKSVEAELASDASVDDVLQAVLDELGIEGFARNIFALFESTNEMPSQDPLKHTFDQKLDGDAGAAGVVGPLLLRRWLFTKEQEAHADGCTPAAPMLVHQALNDIKQGRLYCGPKKKKKLLAAEEDLDEDKYEAFLGAVRKLNMYGGIQFPPCVDDDENDVIVTVTGDRLVIQKVDDEGNPSTDEDDVSVFEYSQLSKVRRRDNLLGFKATDDDGEELTVKLTSDYAEFMETCIKRAFTEQKWADDSQEGGFFK